MEEGSDLTVGDFSYEAHIDVDNEQESDSDIGMYIQTRAVYTPAYYNYPADFESLIHDDVGISGNHHPFPSKIFSLLYMLLHSPRPMVCYFDSLKMIR